MLYQWMMVMGLMNPDYEEEFENLPSFEDSAII